MSYRNFQFINNTIKFNDNFDEINDEMIEKIADVEMIIFNKTFDNSISKLKMIEKIYNERNNNLLSYPKVKNLKYFLHTIKFGCSFNNPIDDYLPITILNLYIGYSFNYPINKLPIHLELLEFNNKSLFNQPIDNLPSNLKKLILGREFNHPVNNLPNKLEILELSDYFNYPINSLPQGLKYLKLGNKFNYPINDLPSTIIHLVIGKEFNKSIEMLPNSIEKLEFVENAYFNESLDNLPSSIGVIICDSNIYKNLILIKLNFFKHRNISIFKIFNVHGKQKIKLIN